MRPGWIVSVAAFAIVAACGAHPRPTPSPIATPSPTPAPTRPPSAMTVAFDGSIGCAQFPYSCWAVLSVDPPNPVPDEWRPPEADPRWIPAYSDRSADPLEREPAGVVPALPSGSHRLVVSLLGSTDVASYAPDGQIATYLLTRCDRTVDVASGAGSVAVLVHLEPGSLTYGGSCSIEVR